MINVIYIKLKISWFVNMPITLSVGQYQENDDDMILISNNHILWYMTITLAHTSKPL